MSLPSFSLSWVATANQTSVPSATSDTLLLAANPGRQGTYIFNDSTATLYLKCGSGASTSSYTIQLLTMTGWQIPFGFTGQINGIWASANGNARVTEFL